MKNRLLLTIVSLLMVASLAMASVPSPTANDLYNATLTMPDGSPAPEGLSVSLVPENETTAQLLLKIMQAMQGQPIVNTYFADVLEAIRAVLPEGTDLAALQLHELAALAVNGCPENICDLVLCLTCPTLFDTLKPVAVLVGLVENDRVNWHVLRAAPNARGGVDVTLPSALLLSIQAGNAVFAILQ